MGTANHNTDEIPTIDVLETRQTLFKLRFNSAASRQLYHFEFKLALHFHRKHTNECRIPDPTAKEKPKCGGRGRMEPNAIFPRSNLNHKSSNLIPVNSRHNSESLLKEILNKIAE
jgi:hypothetical protein